jgi:acyl carrier protein
MGAQTAIDSTVEHEIREVVYDFFASECDVDRSELSDDVDIIETLEGDSLMLLSLLEMVRTKYGLTIELKTLGRHLMKRPANTIGQVIELSLAIVKYGDDIVNVDL